MYTLVLTADEQRAFDWVGDRYNAGQVASMLVDQLPEDREWSDEADITFDLPEHVASEVQPWPRRRIFSGRASVAISGPS